MNEELAAYCLVFTGEGVSIVRLADGFADAVEIVRNEIWMDGDAPPDEWAEWVEQLNDESQWEHHEGREYRYRFDTDLGETGSLTIYRVEDPSPIERLRAEVAALKARVERLTPREMTPADVCDVLNKREHKYHTNWEVDGNSISSCCDGYELNDARYIAQGLERDAEGGK